MSGEILSMIPILYAVFLLSTVCHEAAHALVAKWGGDLTAYAGGQVSLDPVPHIRREPFGLVLMPLLSMFGSSQLMIGWGSAPYDPYWQIRYPRRAALMALAGPLTNFALACLAAVFMHLGVAWGLFVPTSALSVTSLHGGLFPELALFITKLLQMNVLLGVFNLFPFPPLDGCSVLGLILPERAFLRLLEWVQTPMFSIFGLLIALQIFPLVAFPALSIAARLLGISVMPSF
jgi:Zn-dependent protease